MAARVNERRSGGNKLGIGELSSMFRRRWESGVAGDLTAIYTRKGGSYVLSVRLDGKRRGMAYRSCRCLRVCHLMSWKPQKEGYTKEAKKLLCVVEMMNKSRVIGGRVSLRWSVVG